MSISVHPRAMAKPHFKFSSKATHKQAIALCTFTDEARMGLTQFNLPLSDHPWSGLSRVVYGHASQPYAPDFGRDEQIATFTPKS